MVLLTPAEVARAQRIHINTVYNRLAAGDYPEAQKVGSQHRIPADSIGLSDEAARALIEEMKQAEREAA